MPARVKRKGAAAAALHPRLRIVCGEKIAFGPGKAELLARIAETGSIAEAAARIGMSYMRAWSLVQTMNVCFKAPLVRAVRGGHRRGGAELTDAGREVLKRYQQMEADARAAVQPGWTALQRLLRR